MKFELVCVYRVYAMERDCYLTVTAFNRQEQAKHFFIVKCYTREKGVNVHAAEISGNSFGDSQVYSPFDTREKALTEAFALAAEHNAKLIDRTNI